mgnify:CR=1 FL=1
MPMTSSSNQLPSMGQHQLYHQINQQNASNNLENFSPKHYSNNGNGNTNNNSNNNGKVSSSSQVNNFMIQFLKNLIKFI